MTENHSRVSQLSGHPVIDYIAHSPVDEPRVHVEFTGQFENKPVIWRATIVALGTGAVRQYIDVQASAVSSLNVEVGLPLDRIREPDILKTIMMIRLYKKLRRGKYEFAGVAK